MASNLAQMEENQEFDYSKRSQWLRAAVLGANDGLLSTAPLMMGVGAVKQDIKDMILTGAIGEFVSVYSQLDIEVAKMKRGQKRAAAITSATADYVGSEEGESLPNPLQAAAASALAFSTGAKVLLLAASFLREYRVRIVAVVVAPTGALVVFGWLLGAMGRGPVVRSSVRVLVGGWLDIWLLLLV